jgi:hypothetical protein
MSLAAANPALHPSLSGTAESLKDTHEHLTTLGQFWSGLTSICKSALPGTPRVTAPRRFEAQCESYFSSWHVHRHDLLDAICSLELLVDAISIRAPQKISSKHLRSTSNAPTTITLASRHLNLTSPTSNHNNTLPSQSFTTTYRTYHPSPSEDDFPRLCFPFCGGFRR